MASLRPVRLYGLEIPANDEPTHSFEGCEFPCTFRITMAALDPTAPPTGDGPIRSTLKMIRVQSDDDDDDEDSDDDDEYPSLEDLLDEEDSEDDEGVNGGPSDPSKSSKALKKAALRKALAQASEEDDMDVDEAPSKLNKGKGKAKAALDAEEDDDEDELDDDEEYEEFVLCTLNPETHYQQTLDITISENENVLFQVIGSHNIHITGNILFPDDDVPRAGYDSDEEDEDVDYDEDDELDLLGEGDDEEDDLDDLDDPRIEELDDDDDQPAPKLLAAEPKAAKNKNNKRPAEDEVEAAAATTNGAAAEDLSKLSKSQQKKLKKKLKDNAGNAVEVTAEALPNGTKATAVKTDATPEKGEKKVQFAEKLVQGPTNGAAAAKKDDKKPAAATGVRVVQGVTVDDKKLGAGPQAKNGDSVSMRYIGKLEKDKKVFDSNKKGAPFKFKLGAGQVIKGWDIGVAGMAVGGERRITIPAHLAYGAKGAPPDIPKNAVLTFDLKVLEIKK